MTAMLLVAVVWLAAVVGVVAFMMGATRPDEERVARGVQDVEARVVALENYRRDVKAARTVGKSL